MTLSEKIQVCKTCSKRKQDLKTGLVCGLTSAKPTFETSCESFVVDEVAYQKEMQRQLEIAQNSDEGGGFFGAEKKGMKKGMLGGIVMLAIAAIWFFGGLAAGVIFYYPPILAIIGIVAIVKGAAEGNVAGEKYKRTNVA